MSPVATTDRTTARVPGAARSGGAFGLPSLVSLATGGMVGGGIYVALGVVVETAGRWTWLSFVVAGVVAVCTAASYGALSNRYRTGGGSFAFLEEMDRRGAAGSLSWVLIVAYMLTIALYAHAFGGYVAHALGLGAPVPRLLSAVVLAGLIGLDLLGAGKLTRVEVVIVTANLAVLVALAVVGLTGWDPGALVVAGGPEPPTSAAMGAAAIFVSYEGFQLLTYDYDEIRRPERILTPGLVGSALAVVAIYVGVALGATMLVGADVVVERADVALSVAAEEAGGTLGLVAMTVAAAFATSAAINATLFSTAQLARRVSDDGELPAWFDHRNAHGVPDRAVVVLGVGAALLAVGGSLSSLVEAASLAFLAAFGAVNLIAWRQRAGSRVVSGTALVLGTAVGVLLVWRLVTTKPLALAAMVALFVVAFVARPRILARVRVEQPG